MKLAHRVAVAATMLTFFGCAAESQRYEAPQGASSPLDRLYVPERAIEPFAPGMTRATVVGDALIDLGLDPDTPYDREAATRFQVPLSSELDVTVELDRIQADGAARVWTGHVLGESASQVTFAQRGDFIAGTIRYRDRVFTVTPHGEVTTITEWEHDAPGEGAPLIPEGLAPSTAAVAAVGDDGPARVDVLVLYTQEASGAEGADALDAMMDVAMAEANESLRASGVPGRFHLVGTQPVEYDEGGLDYQQTLERLAAPGDGYLDRAQELREATHADLVVLVVAHADEQVGIGFQMTSDNAGAFAEAAYSVVSRDHASPYFTLAHELGHNLGAGHDIAHSQTAAFRADSHGHQSTEGHYRTIMAYGCDSAACPRVARWSNPDVRFNGYAAGVLHRANNAATLAQTMRIAAAFRDEAPEAPEMVAARLTSPSAVDGPLSGSSQWFRWEDVGADAHYLMVGRFPGDRTYHAATAGTATEVLVEGLPEDGSPLGVRLWTLFGTEWRFSDAELTAAPGAPERPAVMQYPDNGSSLGTTYGWFSWGGVHGALGYRLEVGTLEEPGRYLDRETDITEMQVPGLPSDGSVVFVRLSTRFEQGWLSSEAVYSAWEDPNAATFETPALGSEVSGSKVEFVWHDTTPNVPHHLALIDRDSGVVFEVHEVMGSRIELQMPRDREVVAVLYTMDENGGWVSTTTAFRVTNP